MFLPKQHNAMYSTIICYPPPNTHTHHRLEFAPMYGYQWTGNSIVLNAFPQTNALGNCNNLVIHSSHHSPLHTYHAHTTLLPLPPPPPPHTHTHTNTFTQVPTCTTAFNGSITLTPGLDANLSAPSWADHLYDTYLQQDPYFVPGTQYWRWLPVST